MPYAYKRHDRCFSTFQIFSKYFATSISQIKSLGRAHSLRIRSERLCGKHIQSRQEPDLSPFAAITIYEIPANINHRRVFVEISVTLASLDMKQQLHALMQPYLTELSQYDEVDADYPYFDAYWRDDDRWPYLIKADDQIAGFALVNKWSPSQLGTDFAIAEFYILPAFRKNGIGSSTFLLLLEKHKGIWEVSIIGDNHTAHNFWKTTIHQANILHLKQILEEPEVIYRFTTKG